MLNSGHRGHQGHGHLRQRLLGGTRRHRNGGDNHHNLPHLIRSHFGSSLYLFELAYDFSASRAFLVLSCPSKCLQPSFGLFHLLSWLKRTRLMMQSTHSCLVRHCKTFLQTLVLLTVLFPTSKEWALAPQVQWRIKSRPSSQKDLLSSI